MRNKDTLLKEADEYVNLIYEFGRNQNGMYTQVQVKQAYIAGKKSMQKENMELKKQIEKRNKELQEELSACKFAMTMSGNVEKQLREQIEKAKEIIREFFRITTVIDDDFEPDYSQLIEKAEAFLKE